MAWQEPPHCPAVSLFLGVSAHPLVIPLGVQVDSHSPLAEEEDYKLSCSGLQLEDSDAHEGGSFPCQF